MAGKTFKLSIIVDATTKSATKGLGKLKTILGGVAVGGAALGTAVIGGAALAGGAMLKLAIDAAPLQGIQSAFEGIATASGESAETMLAALQKGSAGMVTQRDLMQKYNLAASLVSDTFANELPNAMGYLTKVAAGTGEDMGFMLDSLVRGVGRLSPMILDNLGVQVDLNEAYEAFAPSVGKAAGELSKGEQQTALMNQVMEKLAINTAAMPEVTDTAATSFAALQTKIKDLKDGVGIGLQPALLALLTPLNELADTYGPKVIEWAKVAGEWLGEKIPLAIETLKNIWTTYWPIAQRALIDFWNVIRPQLEKLRGWLSENIPKAIETLRTLWVEYWPKAKQILVDFWDAIRPKLERLKEMFQDFKENVLPGLRDAWDRLKTGWDEIVNVFNTELKPALEELWDALQPLWETLGTGEGKSFDIAAAIGTFTGAAAWLVSSGFIETIKDGISGLADAIDILIRAYELGRHWGTVFRDTLHSMIGTFNEIRHWISVVIDKFNHLKNSLSNFQLPWWLQMGSPTPLEAGLVGIGEALANVQGLARGGLKFGGGMALAGAGAGGGGVTTLSVTNYFGPDSVRSDQDILDLADQITRNLELRGVGPAL